MISQSSRHSKTFISLWFGNHNYGKGDKFQTLHCGMVPLVELYLFKPFGDFDHNYWCVCWFGKNLLRELQRRLFIYLMCVCRKWGVLVGDGWIWWQSGAICHAECRPFLVSLATVRSWTEMPQLQAAGSIDSILCNVLKHNSIHIGWQY